MKKILTHISFVVLLGQLIIAQTAPTQLEITLKHKDQLEQQTEQQLRRILSAHDISKWIFTRKINIESGFIIPHSHPVLTLK
jgi:hypothetical protein